MFWEENPGPGKRKLRNNLKKEKSVLDFCVFLHIINPVRKSIEDLCNGSTPDSDSVCGGSNPSSSANKKTTPSGVVFLLAKIGIRTHLNADVRWTSAATSSKTGGFFDFCLIKSRQKCYRISHPLGAESWGFFFHSPLLKFGFFQIFRSGFWVALGFSLRVHRPERDCI